MTNKAMDQTFETFYYTHMMFNGSFTNETWLNDTLFSFDPLLPSNATNDPINAMIERNRSAIINDTKYGMNSEGNLTIWIAATMGNPDSIA